MSRLRHASLRSLTNRPHGPLARSFSTTQRSLAGSSAVAVNDPLYKPDHPQLLPIPTSALSALASRLNLDVQTNRELIDKVLACVTDPSWDPKKLVSVHQLKRHAIQRADVVEADSSSTVKSEDPVVGNNALLSSLGNHLLGLFVSEHLSTTYPHLPTRALKSATSAYCGPAACFNIAKTLGVGIGYGIEGGGEEDQTWLARLQAIRKGKHGFTAQGDKIERKETEKLGGKGRMVQGKIHGQPRRQPMTGGVRVRWIREREVDENGVPIKKEDVVEPKSWSKKDARGKQLRKASFREWEDAVADCTRAFVGLIYQEQVSLVDHGISNRARLTIHPLPRVSMLLENSFTPISCLDTLT